MNAALNNPPARVTGCPRPIREVRIRGFGPIGHVLSAVGLTFFLSPLIQHSLAGGAATKPEVSRASSAIAMEKYVSKEAAFVLYKPKGWRVFEGQQPGFRTISVTDPGGVYEAAMFHGRSPRGNDVLALTRTFVGGIGQQFPDFTLNGAMVSEDRNRVVFDAAFTVPGKGRRAFRCWISGGRGEFMYASIETPEGELHAKKETLLTILANVRIMTGAFAEAGVTPIQVQFKTHRLSDGSATFAMPRNWSCLELGKGCFVASDPAGAFAFAVASSDVISPQLGVTVPGVPVSGYLPPRQALPFLAGAQGLASDFKIEQVFPRQDIARQMAQVYTAGPVTVEEFVYTCRTAAGRCKGYTFGFSFGSRLGTNWNFRHLTVMAPSGKFDAFVGNFVTMLQSYQIDDAWARNYIAQGMARLRQLQQQTAQIVARNAQDIHNMMQAAYDERQRSMDYIDYQRTKYIRGEQDWISTMEGGTVYHTDSWGTKNTTTEEYWEGAPYDYVHFEGRNPKYNEDMTPVDSRALWERRIR